jgi:hypothetical protein
MLYTVTVEDTITLRRQVEITVEADSVTDARAFAVDEADEAMGGENVTEEQIDNTPYHVVAVHS